MASDSLLQLDGLKGESASRHGNPFLAYEHAFHDDIWAAAGDIDGRSPHVFGEFDLV
jgi:hypothetical protein